MATTLTDATLNVLRHYRMLGGPAKYESRWLTGRQHPVLVERSGLYIAAPETQFQSPLERGTTLAGTIDLYGNEIERIITPTDCMVFGLCTLSTAEAGDWCCLIAEIEGEIGGLVQP